VDAGPPAAELLDREWLADQPEPASIALSPKGRIPEMLWVLEEVGERLGKVLQRLLLHDTGPFGQPLMLSTGGG
jgi:hypothetical protein